MHAEDIHHNDLHAGNIMISRVPKKNKPLSIMIDFGMSGASQKTVADSTYTYIGDRGTMDTAFDSLVLKIKSQE
jgi:tRNA A-37 threonylcarbamoyl transferase component Bud32